MSEMMFRTTKQADEMVMFDCPLCDFLLIVKLDAKDSEFTIRTIITHVKETHPMIIPHMEFLYRTTFPPYLFPDVSIHDFVSFAIKTLTDFADKEV